MNAQKRLLSAALAGAACVGAVSAGAHTLDLTSYVGPGGTYHQAVNVTAPTWTGQAGGFVGTFDGAPIQVFCYEITQFFTFGTTYTDYNIGTPANEGLLSQLYQEAYGAALSSAMNSAAFQLAVWEILYDPDLDLFSGTFHTTRVGNATDLLAQTWLAGLGGYADKHDIILYHSGDHQDFVGRDPSKDLPEPAPLALLGAGLAALVVGARRRSVAR